MLFVSGASWAASMGLASAGEDSPLGAAPILFVVRPQYKPDHHNTETMFQKGEINEGSFEGGSALKVVDFAAGGTVRTLLECPEGIIRDPEVYFDGGKILFAMRRNRDDDAHIYEIRSDGRGLRQLTYSRGVTDIDPMYLADDTIVFASTRDPKYCMCNRHIMANLYRMNGDGANIHQIGKNTLFEGHPTLMPDGRILYDRWEYVDRNFGDAQGLWTVNPDGTNHAVYYGNNTWSPGAVIDPRVVPGTDWAVCTFSSCHDRPWGAIALLDRRLGLDGRAAVVQTWPAAAVELVHETGSGGKDTYGFDLFQGVEPKYEDPYPLTEDTFLCSRMTGDGESMGLYLLRRTGEDLLLYREEGPRGCYDPMPLAARARPPVIASRRTFEEEGGEFYVADVYVGTHMKGVKRGSVKYLRVIETPEKRFWTPGSWNGQGQEAPAMNWHDFNNKRILGTVPVEPDGSAYFRAPSNAFLYFQLLDGNGMMIQSMRSGTMIQPGERMGCIGCHENRHSAPGMGSGLMPRALGRGPSKLEGWYGPARLFSYVEEVQPVFDRHCVQCHDFGKEAGAKLNLAGDRAETFNVSYTELWRRGLTGAIGAGPAVTQAAYSWGSHASKLIQVIREGHCDIQLPIESMDRVVTWIDINAPYYPRYDSAYPDHLGGRCPLDGGQLKRLGELTGTPFEHLAQCQTSQGVKIVFDRPEFSPCLDALREGNPAAYSEALGIIEQGGKSLVKRPRGDTQALAACSGDVARETRYMRRQAAEQRMREAIRKGETLYDTETGSKPDGSQ